MTGKRKPTSLKIAQGTFRKDRENAGQPVLDVADELHPPTWLDEESLAQWNYYLPILQNMHVITKADAAMLTAFCIALSRLKSAEKEIDENGLTVIGQAGIKKNPAVTVADEAMRQIRALGSELGLSPVARPKLVADAGPRDPIMEEAARRILK